MKGMRADSASRISDKTKTTQQLKMNIEQIIDDDTDKDSVKESKFEKLPRPDKKKKGDYKSKETRKTPIKLGARNYHKSAGNSFQVMNRI